MPENISDPLISIITVVYNDKFGLQKTIESVSKLIYQKIEYIIIDGGSNDGTTDVIKENLSIIDYWISEKDNGIYNAMNKVIKASSGVWLNFMNAGDFFINGDFLNKIYLINKTNPLKVDIMVSVNEFVIQQSYSKIIKNAPITFLKWNWKFLFKKRNKNVNYLNSDFAFTRFSNNITKNISEGYTVTFVAMQIAFYLGFKNVI